MAIRRTAALSCSLLLLAVALSVLTNSNAQEDPFGGPVDPFGPNTDPFGPGGDNPFDDTLPIPPDGDTAQH